MVLYNPLLKTMDSKELKIIWHLQQNLFREVVSQLGLTNPTPYRLLLQYCCYRSIKTLPYNSQFGSLSQSLIGISSLSHSLSNASYFSCSLITEWEWQFYVCFQTMHVVTALLWGEKCKRKKLQYCIKTSNFQKSSQHLHISRCVCFC